MTIIEADIKGHGTFRTTGTGFDLMVQRYLPSSVNRLVKLINERTEDDLDYSDLESVAECLLVLAELDGFAADAHPRHDHSVQTT